MANIKKRTGKNGISYQFQVLLGRDSKGKQIIKCTTWKPPEGMSEKKAEKEAEKEAVLFEQKVKSGAITIDGNMKFADYAARWMETADLKPISRVTYEKHLERINQAIGHIPLEKLRPEHLQEFYKNLGEIESTLRSFAYSDILKQRMKEAGIIQYDLMKETGICHETIRNALQGKQITHQKAKEITAALAKMGANTKDLFVYDKAVKLSSTTIRHHHKTIAAILNSAKKSRILPHSVTEYMNAPKWGTPEVRYLDDEQAREYLLALFNEPDIRIRTAFILLLFTGMRRSELCGLEWQDIDFLDSKVHIRRSSHYTKETGVYESETKTKSSNRIVTVTPFVLDILRQYQDWQNEQAEKMGDTWKNEKQRLFTKINGELLMPNVIGDWADRFRHRSGLPHVNPHALRHTFITLQIAAGTDIKTIQSMSGHANATTLLNVYAHAIQSAQDKAAAAMDNMLLPVANEIVLLPEPMEPK